MNLHNKISKLRNSNNFPLSKQDYTENVSLLLKTILPDIDKLSNINLSEEQYTSLYRIHCAVNDAIHYYNTISFEPEKVNVEKSTEKVDTVTITMTTCKRMDLFKKTFNSFLENCEDLNKYVVDYILIDDNSSDEDINEIQKLYPFITVIRKNEQQKGHALSMNILRKLIKTKYFFHLEDDWEFVRKDKYITKCLEVIKERQDIKQVLLNPNYSEDFLSGMFAKSSVMKYTKSGQRYLEHVFNPELKVAHPNCYYWPHFSFRVGLTETSILEELGEFETKPCHFEMEYAFKYASKNYKTCFLDFIYCYHTGRRTYERNNENMKNAYDLNDESQFGKKTKEDNFVVKKQYLTKSYVISLERRPERFIKFIEHYDKPNFVNVFNAVDGKTLQSNQKIMRLFETCDYNYRRGIVGCAISHLRILKELVSNINIDYMLVFEDDARVVPGFQTKLMHLLQTYDFDIMFLGMFPYKHKDKPSFHYNANNMHELPNARQWSVKEAFETSMGGNHGYIITKKGALNILNYINKTGMVNAVDWMYMRSGDVNRMYYCEPFIVEGECYQNAGVDTDIQTDYSSVKFKEGEFFNEELEYWKSKVENVKLCFNNVEYNLDNEVCVFKFSKEIENMLINKPVKFYGCEGWLFSIPEHMLTNKIVNDKTFYPDYVHPDIF